MSAIIFSTAGQIESSPNMMLLAATIVGGIATAWLAYVICTMVFRDYRMQAESWEFEENRRIEIRKVSRVYRWLEPLVEELEGVTWLHTLGSKAKVEKALQLRATTAPWTAEEYLAVRTILGVSIGVGVLVLVSMAFGPVIAVIGGFMAGIGYLRFGAQSLTSVATTRMGKFKRRLPFTVDLMALMMEAGAGFRESLRTVVNESRDHPVGEEMGSVLGGLARGQSMRASLEELQERLGDKDVDDMVFAINKAEELGTPLSKIFLSMADQIRLKRSQWAEVAAGKAQTMITFPGLVIMLACLLIVTAPFVIDAIQNSPF